MSDWTTARVVRDGKGRLRTDDGPIRGLVGDGLVSAESAAAYEHMLGPFTPVLDADGLSVVHTVGDLTARHPSTSPACADCATLRRTSPAPWCSSCWTASTRYKPSCASPGRGVGAG